MPGLRLEVGRPNGHRHYIVVHDVNDAIDLLLESKRPVATLRR